MRSCTVIDQAYHQSRGCLPYTGGDPQTVLFIGVGLLLVGVLIALLLLERHGTRDV